MKAVNLALLLEESVQKHADRPVLIADNKRITYRQLHSAVHAVAPFLKNMGMGKGDKVAIMLPNIPEFVYCCFAVFQSGAVAVLLNTSSTPSELCYLLNNSDAKILITQASGEKRYRDQSPSPQSRSASFDRLRTGAHGPEPVEGLSPQGRGRLQGMDFPQEREPEWCIAPYARDSLAFSTS